MKETLFVIRVTRRMPHVERRLLIFSGAPAFISGFSGVRVTRSLVFCVVFCRSLFVLLSFFFWSLCCLVFFDLRLLHMCKTVTWQQRGVELVKFRHVVLRVHTRSQESDRSCIRMLGFLNFLFLLFSDCILELSDKYSCFIFRYSYISRNYISRYI